MAKTISVPESMSQRAREFVAAEAIPLEVVAGDGGAEVRVVQGAAGQESSSSEWRAGGWIGCAPALDAAGRLGIAAGDLGKLLDHLDIKIRACELGCF